MSINITSLQLKILQLNDLINYSCNYTYSDPRKDKFLKNVIDFHKKLKLVNLSLLNKVELESNFYALDMLYNYLTYINYSTLNSIPFELVSCLEIALDDWVNKEDFIIVTILSSESMDYYFLNDKSQFDHLNDFLINNYQIKLEHRFIVISLPKLVKRDYLANLVLYHELGHFIDFEYNITRKFLIDKYGIQYMKNRNVFTQEESFFSEYFADLFSAMYIKDASMIFLRNFIPDGENSRDSISHPSYIKRNKVVMDFLESIQNEEVDKIKYILKKLDLPELKIRYIETDLNDSNLIHLVPHKSNSDSELHYLFRLGWEIWENKETNFLSTFSTIDEKYYVLNNLLEKSILNYIIVSKWN